MTDPCIEHRPHLSAIADDELGLVPPGTVEHLVRCPDCLDELTTLRLAGARLRAALAGEAERRRRRIPVPPRPAMLVAVAIALVAVGVGVGAWRSARGGTDPVSVAVAASRSQPILRSSDPTTISAWCSQRSERPGPTVALSSVTPAGARSDTVGSATVVTVYYLDAADASRVTVGWTRSGGGTAVRDAHVEARDADGSMVLVVESPAGTAVVGGDASPGVLWRIAGQIEAAGS